MRLPADLARAVLASASSVACVNLPLPSDLSEGAFQQRVIDEAEANGWLHYHTHDSRRSVAGFPDLVLIRAGVLVVAELKVKKNRPTAAQRQWLAAFGGVPGARVFHWRPEHWPEIVALLRSEAAP